MKKDYNQIAAIEKAIAEKYGKVAAQDIRSTWDDQKEKDYLEQVKKLKEKNKKQKKIPTKQNRKCPVCKTYSFSGRDDLYMNRFKCCYLCYVDFVERREEEWLNGKRPSQDYINKIVKGRRKNG